MSQLKTLPDEIPLQQNKKLQDAFQWQLKTLQDTILL
jgi:hypothetical protein